MSTKVIFWCRTGQFTLSGSAINTEEGYSLPFGLWPADFNENKFLVSWYFKEVYTLISLHSQKFIQERRPRRSFMVFKESTNNESHYLFQYVTTMWNMFSPIGSTITALQSNTLVVMQQCKAIIKLNEFLKMIVFFHE